MTPSLGCGGTAVANTTAFFGTPSLALVAIENFVQLDGPRRAICEDWTGKSTVEAAVSVSSFASRGTSPP